MIRSATTSPDRSELGEIEEVLGATGSALGAFERVHAELRPGGVFVDAEQVVGPTDRFTRLYATWHEASARAAGSDEAEWAGAVARMSHDRCASVDDQLVWLREAGFTDVDCLFRDHCFAVLVAVR